jgi:hypothetical protein
VGVANDHAIPLAPSLLWSPTSGKLFAYLRLHNWQLFQWKNQHSQKNPIILLWLQESLHVSENFVATGLGSHSIATAPAMKEGLN